MQFKATIKNLGRIEHAQLQVKPLTVLAGENASGKSFATQSLYCVLETLNQDYVTQELDQFLGQLIDAADEFRDALRQPAHKDSAFLEQLFDDYIPEIAELVERSRSADLAAQEALHSKMQLSLEQIKQAAQGYFDRRSTVQRLRAALEHVQAIISTLASIDRLVNQHLDIVSQGIEQRLNANLKQNFQVTSLADLMRFGHEDEALIELEGIGQVNFGTDNNIDFSFAQEGVMEIQKLESVIFIDSPVFLKIRKGLQGKKPRFLSRPGSQYLKGYPLHVEHLYDLIDHQFIGEPEFQAVSETIDELLEGRLEVSRSGDVEYRSQNGHRTPLSLTAMGVSNLGLIALLLRNNMIRKGSFLIIDEPEVHLHPKWQVAMMKTLYEVAKAGANVIIATHSLDMIKKLELILKTDEKAEELVAVHSMPQADIDASENAPERTALENTETVLQQLSTPFYEMYMQGI